MDYRHVDQQRRQQLLTIVDRGNVEQLFSFLQAFHRRPFRNLAEVIAYDGVIDDQIDFIDCTGTRYNVTPLIIAAGKGSFEKTKILLVHGANPNKQCSTGDTALNLAVHRQKYHIVELLVKYRANPNIANQAGKTALHRAAVSYVDENANQLRILLMAGGDPTIEDRNQRLPIDEAVIANKPEILSVLLSHDRTLTQRAYRAAIIAARLGHDRCLDTLLDYGMDPNIMDRTRTTPLHVAVRSLKLSTARLLVSHGANQNLANNRGETPIGLAEYLQSDQRQSFVNVLIHTPRIGPSEFRTYTTTGTIQANIVPYVHPLIRPRTNWTLDSDEFRSRTDPNTSVQNLIDSSSGTFWCSTQNRDAWVIFDLKHQYIISGMRIIGSDNHSTPRNGHIDVSNALNGPWLKVKDFVCPLSPGNKTDVFFAQMKTRFIRVNILDNYGGDDIRIQGIGFYGVDMRLVELLREYGLERSLQTLLANGVNDLETLDEKRDEILNSSDKYLDVNDHFQFIRLTESLRIPRLTTLKWFNPPQPTVIAGEKLQTFSAAGDEGVTDRVRLEEKLESSPQIRTVLLRDLEPIQGRSLVDFPDYSIRDPGRYKVRVVSLDSPDIQTPWQDIIVGPKPPTTVLTQISDGFGVPSTTLPPRRLSSTPVTDLDEELINGEINFRLSRGIPRTPGPRARSPHPDDDDDDDIDQRRRPTSSGRRPPKKETSPPPVKLINEGTQSEEKSTRNVGTMHESVQTRNFGHEVQPQSTSTQTPASSKASFAYLERPDPPQTVFDEARMSPRQPHDYYDHYTSTARDRFERRTPSPPVNEYRYYDDDDSYPRTDTRPRYHTSSPPISYPCYSRLPPDHPPLPIYRSPTPSPPRQTRYPSPGRRSQSATPRHRPRMHSQETDTSLDAMKSRQHAGVQYEPQPTRDKGTSISIRLKRPTTPIYRPPIDTSRYPSLSRRDDRTERNYYIQPTSDDYYRRRDEYDEEEEEEQAPSMHDQSTMADLIVSLDHFTQCEPRPYMADHYVQTTPTADEYEQRLMFDLPEEPLIRQLPGRSSISIPQPFVVQPPTLPRRTNQSPTRPKRDGLDYTGKILEVSLHHGQQQRTNSIRHSPPLNIGTEHILHQSPTNEYTIPFETRYVYDSLRSSTGQSRRNSSTMLPTSTPPRTHLYADNSIRQSRSNGNFYLSSPPPRPFNSSFRLNITTDQS